MKCYKLKNSEFVEGRPRCGSWVEMVCRWSRTRCGARSPLAWGVG